MIIFYYQLITRGIKCQKYKKSNNGSVKSKSILLIIWSDQLYKCNIQFALMLNKEKKHIFPVEKLHTLNVTLELYLLDK